MTSLVREEITGRRLGKLGAALMIPGLRALKKRIDPDSYGGAPLLGVEGIAIICHGGSSAKAILSAVDLAADYVDNGLTPGLREAIGCHRDLFAAAKADPEIVRKHHQEL